MFRINLEEHLHAEEGELILNSQNLTSQEIIENVIPFINSHTEIIALDVSDNHIGLEGVQALADLSLKKLNLSKNKVENEDLIGNKMAIILAKNTSITHLILRENVINDEGAEALASENKTITYLDLSHNLLVGICITALVANKYIEELNLNFNFLGREGATALSTSQNISVLHVSANLIPEDGMKALAANPNWTFLSMAHNCEITSEIVNALLSNKRLIGLNLKNSALADKELKELLTSESIRWLLIGGNPITNAGIRMLADSKLEHVDLSAPNDSTYKNHISDEDAKIFASNSNIQTLKLENCEVSDVAKTILAEKDPLKRANYAVSVKKTVNVPSLLRFCLFKVEQFKLPITSLPGELQKRFSQPKF